jgi:transcription antitermination factor NusB
VALKILYEKDLREDDVEDLLHQYYEENDLPPEIRQFSELLVRGTLEKRDEIDALLSKYADNWDLKRMAVIDRNILRFATFELIYLPDIPPKVAINEAVNIAKKYSQEKAGKFVNGVLDKINHSEERRPFGSSLNSTS